MQRVNVTSDLKGFEAAKEKLYKIVDRKTVLFLSGGKTPAPLYKKLAKEKILKPGAIAIVDERYGLPFHKDSNEKMIMDTGFIDYMRSVNVPIYTILKKDKTRQELTKEYDEFVRYLLGWFPKSVAILGIGNDGHTAGIPPGKSQISNPKSQQFEEKFVEEFDDFPAEQKERITLTFNALSQMDQIFLLVFGNDKKKGLKLFLEDGPVEEAPARFLKEDKITDKVILITDQRI